MRRFAWPIAIVVAAFALSSCGGGNMSKPATSRPATPPPIGIIGVSHDGTLWLVATDRSSVRRQEITGQSASNAQLSPDGRWVSFDTNDGIWVALAKGGRASLIPGLPESINRANFNGRWAPDSFQIVFGGEEGIYTIGRQGGGPADLIFSDGWAEQPAWSGDGAQIAVVNDLSYTTGQGKIWLIGSDGADRRYLVRGSEPAFSPDGARIAFRGVNGIYTIRVNGSRSRLIARDGYSPVWSPDGHYIAFKKQTKSCSEAGCTERIWIVPSVGGKARPIGPTFFDADYLSWTKSPPPKRLAPIVVP